MRKYNAIIFGLAFLMTMTAFFFGTSVYNAKENMLVQHLNEMDHLEYYDVSAIPKLNQVAGFSTLPFLILINFFEFFIAFKSKVRTVKNVAIALFIAMFGLLCLDVVLLSNPSYFDFSQWGFFWVIFGMTTVAGNVFSIFVPGNKSADRKAT